MATSKTIAALLGPTLVASAVSLLANLATSQALIDELSQIPALMMIAGYAAFCRVLPSSTSTTDGRTLATAGDRDGMAIACRRPPAHGVPTQLAAMMMKVAPSAGSVFPVVAIPSFDCPVRSNIQTRRCGCYGNSFDVRASFLR